MSGLSKKRPVVDPRRVTTIRSGGPVDGPVLYWMDRDQRARDNWALLLAQELALEVRQPLAVAICPDPQLAAAAPRQYGFMLEGLRQLQGELARLNIPLLFFSGQPEEQLARFTGRHGVAALVTDFCPLRRHRAAVAGLEKRAGIPVYEVDAHNIVPCRVASPKLEYAAYTLRPKITRLLPQFLTEFPRVRKHPWSWDEAEPGARLPSSAKYPVPPSLRPGAVEARKGLRAFLSKRLATYYDTRNDPTAQSQSQLSPYLHFGQISAQRVALEVQREDRNIKSQEAFLEELIVRRELADNFCLYNPHYDSFEGFPDWAGKTLHEHRSDARPHLYGLEEFERGRTHDDLWNAAQMQMVLTGKMHGYMRMYWAKKILEWTASPEEALGIAIHLNDRYELDGHDPSGYAGIGWSIGGIHDRPWFERDIFGKIRYMSYGGCKRKFDVRGYIAEIAKLAGR
ncbi:MAG TPA: deoxyribodipyrimidine photo-lyase [Acidobacteriota bacterium]|nr:deoxyribodipyrimidine photo-lyase [Acidobacteriota bacterium]